MAESVLDASAFEFLIVRKEGRVGLVRINRPKALNALSTEVMREMVRALSAFDADESVGCIVVTGDERAFAAGADIKEMAGASPIDMYLRDSLAFWDRVRTIAKPIIAAVSGYCLGGGCELAMSCDMIVASESAKFGQPEINIGVIPGAGGTQRLTRAIGKVRAMEMVLTGEPIGAEEARGYGLINRIVPVELYLEEAMKLAAVIASKPPLAVKLAKESILAVEESHLHEGLQRERKNFYLLFASQDQTEGMAAFVEKRPAVWQGR